MRLHLKVLGTDEFPGGCESAKSSRGMCKFLDVERGTLLSDASEQRALQKEAPCSFRFLRGQLPWSKRRLISLMQELNTNLKNCGPNKNSRHTGVYTPAYFLESESVQQPMGFAFSKFLPAAMCRCCSFATGSHKACILDVPTKNTR
eukprot:s799_g13.t1